MRKTTLTQTLVSSLLCATLVLGGRPTYAHHNGTHDQNPLPPAASGAATILHYNAGSLIVPMDICYERTSFASNAEQDAIVAPLTAASAKCQGNSEKDDGLIPAYSLMFRLIKAGIPVSWAIKSGKTGWNAIDFSVVKAGGGPVGWRAPSFAELPAKFSTLTQISYRGAPFVIDSAFANAAITLMNNLAIGHVEYTQVDYHVAKVGFDAPIYKTFTELPKLAVLDLSDGATNLHQQKTTFAADAISDAVMNDLEGNLWDWVTIPEVNAGALAAYDVCWVPSFDLDSPGMPTVAQTAFVSKLATFADGGGSILFQDGAIGALEGYGSMSGLTYTADKPKTTNFMVDNGLVVNGITSAWDNGSATETTKSSDYSDPASQFGGDMWTGIGGSKVNWKPRYDKAYLPGVRRMVYSHHTTDDSKRRWDFATRRRKDNDVNKGMIYYLGGDHWRKNTASGFRILLNTILATTPLQHTTTTEVARSSPVVATVTGVETEFAGTLEVQSPPQTAPTFSGPGDASAFEFPWVEGHMRALDVAQLSTGETDFEDASSALLWDAATEIPSVNYAGGGCAFPATGTCRRIFTDTGSATAPTETLVVQGNHTQLMTPLGVANTNDADTLISRIHAGRKNGGTYEAALGGVDRSTPAVIEPSPLIPNGRATIAYFGATDGMLHAVCAEAGPGCPSAGVELWAFMPSTELGKVRLNATRLDGSPKVADVYGNFGGVRAVRTVLTIQTGDQSPSATYGIDITDPRSPDVLWKVTTPGPGVGLAMGWVRENAAVTPMTFAQTALDPTGTQAGFEVRSIDSATGAVRWTETYPYAGPREPANPEVPLTAMPGGVSLIPSLGGTTIESLLVPTIYGQVYKLDALTGDNVLGTEPLFDFGEDFHPIGAPVAIYRDLDGLMRGLVVSGGFADPFSPSATLWAPDDVNQYAVGFPIGADAVPVTRSDVASDSTLGIHIDFGVGQRAFSPAVIAGGQVFITTDETNVNSADYGGDGSTDTGKLWTKSLENNTAATYVTIPSGAAAVDVSLATGTVLSGGHASVQVSRPVSFDASGAAAEVAPTSSSARRLWLRLR